MAIGAMPDGNGSVYFVLDAAVTAAWCFADEATDEQAWEAGECLVDRTAVVRAPLAHRSRPTSAISPEEIA